MGGASTRASNLVTGLLLNGCNVTVIAAFPHYPHGKIPRQYKGIPIKIEQLGKVRVIRTFMPPIKSEGFSKRILLMGTFAFSALFALPWIGKIDAVWTQSWIPGLVCGKLKQVPVALNVDDLTLEDIIDLKLAKKNSLLMKVGFWGYRLFYNKGNVITPISSGYIETIAASYGVDKSKICVVQIGVDLSIFTKPPLNHSIKKPFRVVYAGVLGLGYDFEQVFGAAQILREKGIPVEFILHGSGESSEIVKLRIKQLQLTNVKISEKLFVSKKEVAAFLNEADALILPMRSYDRPYQGIPSKLYEYQAAGKPIICCSEGEPVRFIQTSNSGVAVKPGDSKALAEAVQSLYEDQKTVKALGEAGRKFVEENFSLERIGAKLVALFNDLRNSRR
jgi:glycosyltransferase involved in cell wall biosynthesis